jgi:hypothetical protein
MLNTFPSLLTYSQVGPFILRVVLGLIVIDVGILKFRSERADWIKTFDAYRLRPAFIRK